MDRCHVYEDHGNTVMSHSCLGSIGTHVLLSVLFMGLGAIAPLLIVEGDFVSLLRRAHNVGLLSGPSGATHFSRRRLGDQRFVVHTTRRSEHLVYIPEGRILTAVATNGGSTSLWKWLYTGTTGRKAFNCSTKVQNVRARCWENRAIPLADMSKQQKEFAVTNKSVLRLAVWRDPFSRLISSWKSKFACETRTYGTDYADRERMVPELRRQAGLPDLACLNISEFAETLERIRRRIEVGVMSVDELNRYVAPQEFFFHYMNYGVIIDADQLSNASKMLPVAKRLPYLLAAGSAPQHLHRSAPSNVVLTASVANLIAKFAALTEPIPSVTLEQ